MADGLFDDVMDNDEEIKPHAAGRRAGTEAFAAAVAANLCAIDPDVTRTVEDFISEQTQLLNLQREYRVEEHAARQALLKQQVRENALRRSAIRLRIALLSFAALICVFCIVVLALLARDAVASRRVVIDVFHAPTDVPARGDDGTVIAGRLRDELDRLQNATDSSSAVPAMNGAWGNGIQINLPQTHTFLGEMLRTLRERYGHDVRISGDLTETTAGGLSLTVRASGMPAKTVSGAAADRDLLIGEAAEYLYSQSQPLRFGRYLVGSDRSAEAIEFYPAAVANADSATQAALLDDWAAALKNTGGPVDASLSLYRRSLKAKPDLWHTYVDVMNLLWPLGKEQEMWEAGNSMLSAAGARPGPSSESNYARWDMITWNLNPWLAAQRADAPPDSQRSSADLPTGLTSADIDMRLHDPAAAGLALAAVKDDPNEPLSAAIGHFVRGRLALDAGDAARAVSEMEAFDSAVTEPGVSGRLPGYQCWIAPAEEAVGRGERADAALKSGGTYVDCYRFRADLLDARGDWPGAQQAYTEAVALAPALPAAYYSWGVALAKHGDREGASAKLQEAIRRGPGWADPMKAWGDLLAQQGQRAQALSKYDAALKLAPNWTALKSARAALGAAREN